ncbi:hypothetical protein DXG03_007647 [Asterophora parasitica]|uniref:Uncharacterized protein n=1 Tax=Asterophora parasitica TaxID=117018 RepID=A0A9P7G4K0_9AGAR|nr:hypothetical protein DXG03_007647 [Asterophora parasitica]
MSLISDTDYLIHGLRLSYLRDVEDIYGPRLITLDPSYNSNPFIIAASLADTERWPELVMPSSPQVSDDEGERPLGFPGARLKHTQTIMGGRTGGLGMRVHGKRASTSRRLSAGPHELEVKNFISANAPVQSALSSSVPVSSTAPLVKSLSKEEEKLVEPPLPLNVKVQGPTPTVAEEPPVQKVVQFIPKFKGAAEMERRRRVRMAARRGPGGAVPAPQPQNLSFDTSSEEEGGGDSSSDGDFDDDVPGEVDSLDDGDDFEFRPPVAASPSVPPPTDILFARKKVPVLKPLKSSLSSMLASSDASSNPFSEVYAAVSGRGESAAVDVAVYFPHATQPRGKMMQLNVRKDATVEEVIGFSLWTYWKEGWLPKLDEGLSGEDDPKWETKVSAVGWILRISEEDGEVDDDFPPPDRLGRISKFNADAYAVLEATSTQVQQNQLLDSKIQRQPSRMTKLAEKLSVVGPSLTSGAPSSAVFGSTLGSAGMYMQEALELVCRKRKLSNPNDYALLLADMSILIPLDRTVASLQGKRELLLVKRSMLPQIGGDALNRTGKTTDPNGLLFALVAVAAGLIWVLASIFKRMSDTPEVQYPSLADYTAGYKKYNIFRKAPMLLARQERTLAIDGVYIHIMPSTNKAMKAVFDSGKTSSYHIKSIADCQQSAKTSSVFKLVLSRGGTNKRYDFEAESPRLAGEIVQTIRSLKASLERSGTVSKSRRSRQVE